MARKKKDKIIKMKVNKWGVLTWMFLALFALVTSLELGIGFIIGTYLCENLFYSKID